MTALDLFLAWLLVAPFVAPPWLLAGLVGSGVGVLAGWLLGRRGTRSARRESAALRAEIAAERRRTADAHTRARLAQEAAVAYQHSADRLHARSVVLAAAVHRLRAAPGASTPGRPDLRLVGGRVPDSELLAVAEAVGVRVR